MAAINPGAPDSYATEEALRLRFQEVQAAAVGPDVVVVSGYSYYTDGKITGSSSSDSTPVNYEVHLDVGPQWRNIVDVSPSVTVSRFSHFSSDTADVTGYGVESCTWEEPTGQPPMRIHLIAQLHIRGGPDASIRGLAYHFTARGNLMSASPTWDPGAYFKENVA
jgi:hypothetical protein